MKRNLRRLGVSLVASLLMAGLMGCEIPGTAGGNQQPHQQTDEDQQNGAAKSLHEGTISKDETWKKADGPHLIRGEVSVESEQGVTLTIEPGTEVRFESGASLYVGYGSLGYLKAQGTAEAPIVFTSASSSPERGDWLTIYLGNGAAASVLTHCTIKYGGGGGSEAALTVSGVNNKPTLQNCKIESSAGYGIRMAEHASFKVFTDNLVKGSGKNPMRIGANEVGSLGGGNTFEGNDQEVLYVEGEKLTQSATWRNFGIPYRIQDALEIEGSDALAVLKLEAGSTLEFGPSASLWLGYNGQGALYAVGEASKPITLTGVGDQAGSWAGITMNGGTKAGVEGDETSTVLQHVVIAYGCTAENAMLYLDNAKPILKNVTFRNGVPMKHAVKGRGAASTIPTHNDLLTNGNTFEEMSGLEYDLLADPE